MANGKKFKIDEHEVAFVVKVVYSADDSQSILRHVLYVYLFIALVECTSVLQNYGVLYFFGGGDDWPRRRRYAAK